MVPINKPGILILSPFYYPNIGGVETHLSDLTSELVNRRYPVYVLTYSPLTTSVSYQSTENNGLLHIRRYRWFGRNLFHTLEKLPLFDFIYLTPYLLIRSLTWMIFNKTKINIIHSQGINAAFIGNVLGFIFKKKHITSTHAVYDHLHGFSQKITTIILNHTHHILCLSQTSADQLLSWQVVPSKISLYSYWLNFSLFSPSLSSPTIPTFLFVGRLISKKGIGLFLELSTHFPQYKFIVVGTGPEENSVKKSCKRYANLQYLGFIENSSLSPIYQQSTALCLPSQYQEGYGRVAMEAVASGIPVIAPDSGGTAEALDSTVAILIKPTLKSFIKSIKTITQPQTYSRLKNNCRPYALKHFSPQNINQITKFY